MLFPDVNVSASVIVSIDLATSFGRGPIYSLDPAFLSAPFTLHLGFGDAQYAGPTAA